jgi:phenylacetate-CoA ligase
MASQRLERGGLRALQERKLRRLVRHAYRHVPYYRSLLDDAGVGPGDIGGLEDLVRVPITTKLAQRDAPRESLISRAANRDELRSEHSSGSTGTPFRVVYDRRSAGVRSAMFFRGLHAAGYRPGQRLLLVTGDREGRRSRSWMRWRYASIEAPPAMLLRQLREFAPHVLYGCVTPLRLLAEELAAAGPSVRAPRAVVTTAETLDLATRRFLERAFRCRVFDFYGLSEMGLVAWECDRHGGYHVSEDTVLVEAVPDASNGRASRLVMTNLESTAMPFIRFDTGDLGVLGSRERCSCGRTLLRLRRVEGRVVDCLQLAGGRRVTPYALTCLLERIPGMRRFQVVQRGIRQVTVRYEPINGTQVREEGIHAALRSVLGGEIHVSVESKDSLDPEPGRKFRVVESLLRGESK